MISFDLLPRKWFSSDYRILREGTEITEFKFFSGPERSAFTLAGSVYLAHKEKWNSPNFFLHLDQTLRAQAEKPSAFRQSFTVVFDDKLYTLKPMGTNRFALREQDREVGWVAKQDWFSRKATAELPDELPLPICAFVIWLVLLMWKRDADSSA